jgi:Arc/MetJ family transcription regulator
MGSHMKTTIEISDALLAAARRVAARQRTTLRRLVEDGLRHVLHERRARGHFRLRKASFKGKGLRAPLTEGDWDRIRELAYENRGA